MMDCTKINPIHNLITHPPLKCRMGRSMLEGEAGGEGTHTKTGVRGEEEVGESVPAATTY